MAYELRMDDDGILRIGFVGDVSEDVLIPFMADYAPYLEAATDVEPLNLLVDGSREGKYSGAARRKFGELGKD